MNEKQTGPKNPWGRVKTFLGMCVLAFAITLAIIVGNRLSDQALAVLAGAVCGVGAAIPTSLLVVAVTRRGERAAPADRIERQPRRESAYPPVVVVAPPQSAQQQGYGWNTLPYQSSQPPVQRQFTMVGSGSSDTGFDEY